MNLFKVLLLAAGVSFAAENTNSSQPAPSEFYELPSFIKAEHIENMVPFDTPSTIFKGKAPSFVYHTTCPHGFVWTYYVFNNKEGDLMHLLRARVFMGMIFSLFHLDVEKLRKNLGIPSAVRPRDNSHLFHFYSEDANGNVRITVRPFKDMFDTDSDSK